MEKADKPDILYSRTLPLASIVKIVGNDNLFMLARHIPQHGKVGYRCIPYPIGLFSEKSYRDINKEDILEVYFYGCWFI